MTTKEHLTQLLINELTLISVILHNDSNLEIALIILLYFQVGLAVVVVESAVTSIYICYAEDPTLIQSWDTEFFNQMSEALHQRLQYRSARAREVMNGRLDRFPDIPPIWNFFFFFFVFSGKFFFELQLHAFSFSLIYIIGLFGPQEQVVAFWFWFILNCVRRMFLEVQIGKKLILWI